MTPRKRGCFFTYGKSRYTRDNNGDTFVLFHSLKNRFNLIFETVTRNMVQIEDYSKITQAFFWDSLQCGYWFLAFHDAFCKTCFTT